MAHGDILRNIVDGANSSRPWANAEIKLFTFQSANDEDAALVEIKEEAKARGAKDEPTSSEMA